MSAKPSPRLRPLPEDAWVPQLDSVRESLGGVLNVHRVMAHDPDLMRSWTPFRRHVVSGSSLVARHRELVILRVAHRAGVAYEWHHHQARAAAAGVGSDEIEAVRAGAVDGWVDEEAILFKATDELLDEFRVSDTTWVALIDAFTVNQILDLIFTVGMYVTLALFINSTGVELEDEAGAEPGEGEPAPTRRIVPSSPEATPHEA